MKSVVGMEAASKLTATCSSTALGRDVAAAAFRLSPLALRRMDFASLGRRTRRRTGLTALSLVGRQGSGWLPRSASADRPRTKRRRSARSGGKQFGFRRNPLRTTDSWKTFAWILLSWALLRCSRALAECPAACVFGGRQWARAVRNAAMARSVQSGATSGDGSGSTEVYQQIQPAVGNSSKIHPTLNPRSAFATKPASSRRTPGKASGKSSEIRPGPKARAAAPCSQAAAEAASNAGMPCAARPATKPVRTSPEPAVARVGAGPSRSRRGRRARRRRCRGP